MTTRSIFAGLAIALIAAAPALVAAQGEPTLDGVPLSEWIRRLHEGGEEGKSAAGMLLFFPPAAHDVIVPELVKSLERDSVVRSAAAFGLGRIGPTAIPAILPVLYGTDDSDVAANAAEALIQMGKRAVPALIQGLSEPNPRSRQRAVDALNRIGAPASRAAPRLVALLGNEGEAPMIRLAAAAALGKIGPRPGVVAALSEAVGDPVMCREAAAALGEIGPEAADAVPVLIDAVRGDEYDSCDSFAALGRMGSKAVAPLIAVIRGATSQPRLRENAFKTLAKIGPDEAREAVPFLVEEIRKTPLNEWASYALAALASADPRRAVTVLPHLARVSGDRDGGQATAAIQAIAEALQDQEKREQFSDEELENARAGLDLARTAFASRFGWGNVSADNAASTAVARAIQDVEGEQRFRRLDRQLKRQAFFARLFESVWARRAAGVGAYLLFFAALWSALLALRPVWLLRLGDALRPYTLKLPAWLGGLPVSLRLLTLLEPFLRRDRVLDAWVLQHVGQARENFARRRTVHDREVHIPVPAVLDRATVPALEPGHLRPVFSGRRSSRGCLLVWGEGGSGKTSLACQIGRWALAVDPAERLCAHYMLPLLLEQELEPKAAEGRHPLAEAARGQLQALIGADAPVSDELLDRLLRRRRLLVIVDHFSELGEATRALVRPASPDFSVHALLLTSRSDEEKHLGEVPKTAVQPLRIEGNRLSSFMEAYLTQRGKRALFDDPEYFDACRRLSVMVGTRELTVLIAKLYAEQMISSKEAGTAESLPESIPELMLRYVNELNRNAAGDRPDNREVQRDLKLLAWECLKRTFRPAPAPRDVVLEALRGGSEGPPAAENRLRDLEHRLRLVETIGAAEDQVRLTLDPLAEYLAAIHLVETWKDDRGGWARFLAQAEAMPGAPAAVRGFVAAVQEAALRAGAPPATLVVDAMRIRNDSPAGAARAAAGSAPAAAPNPG